MEGVGPASARCSIRFVPRTDDCSYTPYSSVVAQILQANVPDTYSDRCIRHACPSILFGAAVGKSTRIGIVSPYRYTPSNTCFRGSETCCPDSRVLCHAPSQNAITRSAYQPWRRIFPEWVARPTSTPAGNAMKNCDVELRRELTEEGVEPPRSPEAAWVQLRASDMVFYVAQ